MVSVCSGAWPEMISLILRSPERSPVSRKFFITCWVMVEAPRSRPPSIAACQIAAAMPRGSKPCADRNSCPGADEGVLHLVGDLVDRGEDPPLAGEFIHELALAGIDAAERRGS